MSLGDFGSMASIISLILGVITGFGICKLTIKYNFQFNKLFSIFNSGTISQENKKGDS